MIIIMTGPSGVGKTDTSWALLEKFKNIIFLDSDWFASRVPFSWKNEGDVESLFQLLSLVMDFHIKKGENNFIIPITLEMAVLYKKYMHYFNQWTIPIKSFRLRCSNEELVRRITQRPRIDCQKQEELAGVVHAQKSFDTLFPDSTLFRLIDTTHLTELEVAEQLFVLASS